ncbi:MAG: hypothetical protein U0414_31415 [Polyangiaceae bacterium]
MTDSEPDAIPLSARVVWPWLTIVAVLVSLAGLFVELLGHAIGLPLDEGVVPYFSLSHEANVPTYFSAALLAGAAVLSAIAAKAARALRAKHVWNWWLLAGGFAFMSIDEAIELHEYANFIHARGLLYFSWVIPAGVLVVILGLGFLRFLGALPRGTRVRFVIAGAMYVIGAVGFELPLGLWTERFGNDSLGYALLDWVEESLEIAGLLVFLHALIRHLGSMGARVRFVDPETKRHG